MSAARVAILAACLLSSLLSAPAAGQFPWRAASHAGLDLEAGQALFERRWVGAPASTRAASGLGPLYNARSCASCHPKGGGGPPLPDVGGVPGPALVVMLGEGSRFGEQLQGAALPGLRAEARVELRFEEVVARYADGASVSLRRPRYDILPLDGQALEEGLRLSPRLAPSLHGMAALEALSIAAAGRLIDAEASDGGGEGEGEGEGVRGVGAAGRFGLQGAQATLELQVARALSLDLGLANPLLEQPAGDCTPVQQDCLAAAPPGPEVGHEAFELLLNYVRSLPPPAASGPLVEEGLRLFETTGCAACHSPNPRVGASRPWSDLLLHDMGEDLADFTPRGETLATRWRTAPLWGLGTRAGALLHDGRARSIEEAVLWHGGEALGARERFQSLTAYERQALLDFLQGL